MTSPRPIAGFGDTHLVGGKDRGPRPQPDEHATLIADLTSTFRWRGDRTDDTFRADLTGWWANPTILARLGRAIAELFVEADPTVVLGPQSRGALVGALVARELGCGLIEFRKNPGPAADSDRWLTTTTRPDYRDRNLRMGIRREHLPSGHRVLFVDDWIATGGQAFAAHELITGSGASWCGAAVLVDALTDSRLRRDLNVRSLLHVRDLD